MEALQLDEHMHKGKIVKMADITNNDQNIQVQENNNLPSDNNTNNKEKAKFIIEFIVSALSALAIIGGFFLYFDNKFDKINDKIDMCLKKEDIKNLEDSVEKMNSWIMGDIDEETSIGAKVRLNNLENDISEIQGGIEEIHSLLNISAININDSIILNDLVYTSSMENIESSEHTPFQLKTYLGKDAKGNEYELADVLNQKILLTYTENNQEVYFLGQLNEQLHWDGLCLTNSYNADGILQGICESNFTNGNRIDYKSFYLSNKKNEWIYTDRICESKGNLGISKKFQFEYNVPKNFTNTNVKVYDLLSIDDFTNIGDKTLLTYYSGYTKDGVYNDTYDYGKELDKRTPPYEIIFNSDGTISVLYIGQFKDGKFNDQTGNAQEFVLDMSQSPYKYFYYQGTFTSGERDHKVTDKNYVTPSEIEDLIKNVSFDIELNWHETENII